MTLLIGAHYLEGMVLGTDRKFVGPGSSFSYGSKILKIPPEGNYFSTAGLIGLADAFLEAYNARASERRPIGILEVKTLVEDVLRKLNERYKESLPFWLRDVVGILIGEGSEGIEGYHIVGGWPGTRIRKGNPVFVGAGEDYARSFSPLLNPELEEHEMAEAIVWIISWVASVCDPVGFEQEKGPDVLILTQGKEGIESKILSREKAMEICREVRIDDEKIREILLPSITGENDFEEPTSEFFAK